MVTKIFFPMFSSRNFIALALIFRPVILFFLKLTLCIVQELMVEGRVFLHMDMQLSQHYLLKKRSLLCQHLCVKSVDHISVGLFLDCIPFHGFMAILLQYHTVDFATLEKILKSGSLSLLILFPMSKLFWLF